MKRSLAIGAAAAALTFGLAPSATAGEVTGNGKPTGAPTHSASICSYSGLDDGDDDEFDKTQNWGQLTKEERAFYASLGFAPGDACKIRFPG